MGKLAERHGYQSWQETKAFQNIVLSGFEWLASVQVNWRSPSHFIYLKGIDIFAERATLETDLVDIEAAGTVWEID